MLLLSFFIFLKLIVSLLVSLLNFVSNTDSFFSKLYRKICISSPSTEIIRSDFLLGDACPGVSPVLLCSGPGVRLSCLCCPSGDPHSPASASSAPSRLLLLHLVRRPSSTSLLGLASFRDFFPYPDRFPCAHLEVLWLERDFKMKIISCCHLESLICFLFAATVLLTEGPG